MRQTIRAWLLGKTKPVAIGVGVVLVASIGLLLRSNYLSQVKLQASVLRQLTHDTEKLATTVSYFISERKDDLRNLASSREIAIYFENKALGMSMAYGLSASLLGISERFEGLLNGKIFHGEKIYERIVFLDKDGWPLIDTRPAEAYRSPGEGWRPYLTPETDDPLIITEHHGSSLKIVIAIAYFFKEQYAGQVLAFISTNPLSSYLMRAKDGGSERLHGLFCEKGDLHVFNESSLEIPASSFRHFKKTEGTEFHRVDLASGDANIKEMFVSKFPIMDTSLSLAALVPRFEITGYAAPWHLPLAMGMLILLILGVTFILWRYNTHNAVLHARLDEAAKRENEVTEKNLQLENEMAERKRVETALRENEEKYRAIFDSFQDVYFRTDGAGVITVISPSILEEGGYDPEEVVGRPVGDFYGEKASHERFVSEMERSGRVGDFELKLLRKDGTVIDVSINAHSVADQDGVVVGMEGVLRNITKRKQDEAALKESERRLDMALKGGDLGVWSWDIVTGEASFSNRWAEMLGYSPDEIEPHVSSWEKLVHPEDIPRVTEALHEHMEGRTALYESEHRLKSKSGEWMWILDRGQAVERNSEGKPVRMAGTHLDVTPRKHAELELKIYQQDLERLMEVRTRQLQEAQKELINRAMESGRAQLSAMVLHNIGNAITPLKVHVENMRSEEPGHLLHYLEKCYEDLKAHAADLNHYVNDDSRGREVFNFMENVIHSMGEERAADGRIIEKMNEAVSYISEILTLQQSYAAREQETKQHVDLNAIINDAVNMQDGSLKKRGIEVHRDFAPNLKKLLIDKNRLMQVIVNLIKNSYEAIDELNGDGEEKWIRLKSFRENGQVGFEIADSGIGIDNDQIGSVQEFGKSNKGSSGFGLYYCKMFVEANRGVLDISSGGRGRGAAVRVAFDN